MREFGPRQIFGLAAALAIWLTLEAGPAEAQRGHRVRSGDSFARIARRYDVTPWNLAAANDMRPSDALRPGMVLRIPARGVVYVRPGQNLWEIARAQGVSVKSLARANRMRPDDPLRAGDRVVLPGYEAQRSPKGGRWGDPENAGLVHLRANEHEMDIQLRKGERRVPYEGMQRLAKLMRDELDEGANAPTLHPRLAVLLADISDHFGGRDIILYSGFREPGGYTNETSRHVHGQAADIRIMGVSKRALWNYCRTLRKTGCGFYPRSMFVHVDVRGSASQWVDWSKPGQRPMYGNLRGPFRWRGSGGRSHDVGRQITRPKEVPLEVRVVDAPPDADKPWKHTVTAEAPSPDGNG
jgi:uncharacterized protein YcbK (DUF882 family)/LysM repeat protein